MKTSVKWLRDYIDFEDSLQELSDKLSLAGLEVEAIEALNEIDPNVVVGEILSRDPHPNADKLSVCQVSDGTETYQVVCGAPNCDAGKKVPFAKVGADFGDGFVIKKAKLRGEASFGMLCSASELKLDGDASGLLELDDTFTVGQPLQSYFEKDYLVETEVTPNRPDWLSQVGIARELAALNKTGYRKPEIKLTENSEAVADFASVEVSANDLCPRYTARVVKNVKIGPSPKWMREYLLSIGLRPINNVVDITNFVLMELGQPLHAFDYDKLAGHQIIVRRATEGEKMPLLDGSEHELSAEDLVIADADKPVALAGIMGGGNSEIDDNTTNVLLESAAFCPTAIRRTSYRLHVHSDSSYRFERGTDVEMVEMASARAAQLLCEYAGGELVGGLLDSREGGYVAPEVSCRFARINRILGVEVTPAEVEDIFNRLEMPIAAKDDETITVAVPAFRLDIQREADLIEEVARVYGLNNIPASPISGKSGGPIVNDSYYETQVLRDQFLGLGFDECVNYSLMNEKAALLQTGIKEEELVTLSNPLSSELSAMRPTLLPYMLQVATHNFYQSSHNLSLFELGRVISKAADGREERLEAVMVLCGQLYPERFAGDAKVVADFYDLKGRIEGLFESRRLFDYAFKPASHPFFIEGATAEISVNGEVVGYCGEVHDDLTKKSRKQHPLFMAVLDAEKILTLKGKPSIFEAMPTAPATTRDVSILAETALNHADVMNVISQAKEQILEDVALVDIFEDEKVLGPGKKSMTYSFTYRHESRTLKDEEVNQKHKKLVKKLTRELNIEIR